MHSIFKRSTLLASVLLWAVPAVLQAAEPGLEDAENWIVEKVPTYGGASRTNLETGTSATIDYSNMRFNSCMFQYRENVRFDMHGTVDKTYVEYTVPMGEIDAEHIELIGRSEGKSDALVVIHTRGDVKSIKMDSSYKSGVVEVSKTTFRFSDEGMAKRVRNAFSHIAKLCTRKGNVF